jgi:hypothetical protein
MFVTRRSKNFLFFVFDSLSNLDCGQWYKFCIYQSHPMSAPATQSVDSQGRVSFVRKVISVSIHSFVEWLDTFSYALRPADVTVKEVNHIRCFAIDIAKYIVLLSCRVAMGHVCVLQLEISLSTLVTTWFTLLICFSLYSSRSFLLISLAFENPLSITLSLYPRLFKWWRKSLNVCLVVSAMDHIRFTLMAWLNGILLKQCWGWQLLGKRNCCLCVGLEYKSVVMLPSVIVVVASRKDIWFTILRVWILWPDGYCWHVRNIHQVLFSLCIHFMSTSSINGTMKDVA